MTVIPISSTEVEPHEAPVPAATGYSFSDLMTVADRIAWTAVVPSNLRGKPDEVLAVLLYGTEVGLPPMQSLQLVDNIEGRTALNAQGQRALILSKGHDFWVIDAECTRERAVVHAKRKGSDVEREATFTMEDARIAGLTEKKNWKKNPRPMLIARATTLMSRLAFADVVMGLGYDPEELEDVPPRPYDIDVELARRQDMTIPPPLSPEHLARFEAACKESGVTPTEVIERAGPGVVNADGQLLAGTNAVLRQAREAIMAERAKSPADGGPEPEADDDRLSPIISRAQVVQLARLFDAAFAAAGDAVPAGEKVRTKDRLRKALTWLNTNGETCHLNELTADHAALVMTDLHGIEQGDITWESDEDGVTWWKSDGSYRVEFAEFEPEEQG